MRPFTNLIVLAASLALAGPAYSANPQTPAATPAAKASASSRSAAPRKATSLIARGTIAGFDGSSKVLTIKTAKGQEQFTLADSVRIREASKRLSPADLGSLNGRSVSVRYTEAGSQRTVQSVEVSRTEKKTAKT
jgi:hypothetical protein